MRIYIYMYISAISINGEVGSLVWPLDAYRPLNKFLCGESQASSSAEFVSESDDEAAGDGI